MNTATLQGTILFIGAVLTLVLLGRSYIKLGMSRLKTALVLMGAVVLFSGSVITASAIPALATNMEITETGVLFQGAQSLFSRDGLLEGFHSWETSFVYGDVLPAEKDVEPAQDALEAPKVNEELSEPEPTPSESYVAPEETVEASAPINEPVVEVVAQPEPAPEPVPEPTPEPESTVEAPVEEPAYQEWWSTDGWLIYDPPHTDELFYYWDNYYCAHRGTLYGSRIAGAEIGSTILLDGSPVKLLGREYFAADIPISDVLNVVGWDKLCFQTCNETGTDFQVVYGVYV